MKSEDKNITFCEECRDDTHYNIITKEMSGILRGEEYIYSGKEARCDICNSLVYIEEINDYNLKALYDEYRRKHDIISLENIMEIPNKYEIGKRPLSLLLGWGENTFSRYYDGDIPSKEHSDILKKLL